MVDIISEIKKRGLVLGHDIKKIASAAAKAAKVINKGLNKAAQWADDRPSLLEPTINFSTNKKKSNDVKIKKVHESEEHSITE